MDSRQLAPFAEYREGEIIAPGQETPLPAELVAGAKPFATMARAASTRRSYAHAWQDFADWARAHGRTPLPAAAETIAAWLYEKACYALPEEKRREKGLPFVPGPVPAKGSLDQALPAITAVHRAANMPFDRKNPVIAETWRGVARSIAGRRVIDKAAPLRRDQLQRMLAVLRPTVNAEARDAALLALGWVAHCEGRSS